MEALTIPALAATLAPIAEDALASTDVDVLKVATVLAAVMGCIDDGPVDIEALDALAFTAKRICEHRSGLHDLTSAVTSRAADSAEETLRTRALFDWMIKARQLLLQAGASVERLSIRLHPADYLKILVACKGGKLGDLVGVDADGAPVSILHMPIVQDLDIAIGAPKVVHPPGPWRAS